MENWPVLITFNYPHEAHLVKSYLESNGIEIILKDELATQVVNIYSSAIGGVKLLVRASDYEKGIQLLKEGDYLIDEDCKIVSKVEFVQSDKTTNKKLCPFCSSENIAAYKKTNDLTAIFIAIISLITSTGAISTLFKSSFKCYDCGKEWKFNKAC